MNEVRILVRTTNAAKAGFEEVNKEVDAYAKKLSDTFATQFADNLTKNLTAKLQTQLTQVSNQARDAAGRAGDTIGDTIGQRASQRITTRIIDRLRNFRGGSSDSDSTSTSRSSGLADRDTVKVNVDVDRGSFLSRIAGLGRDAAARFSDSFKSAMTGVFSGDIVSTIIKGGLITGLAATIAPALGAAVTSGILLSLGGGVLALGIAGAMQDPRIKAAMGGIKEEAKSMFESFGKNFRGPLENFLTGGTGGGESLLGFLRKLTPAMEHLGTVLGPVADKLGSGVIGFLQNSVPSIMRAIEAGAPFVDKLSEKLPGLGRSLGKFFDRISDSGPDALIFFDDFLRAVGFAIEVIGELIRILSKMYNVARFAVLAMVDIFMTGLNTILAHAVIAFGWIPGLGPKLKAAQNKAGEFSEKVRNELKKIPEEKNFTLRFRIVGLAAANAAIGTARILSKMGLAHGGIKGAQDGGMKSGMTWVGEHGPELVDLPPGAQVHTAGDSRRMAGGQSGGRQQVDVRLIADRTTERGLVDKLFQSFRQEIGDNYGGDVQVALGRN